MLIGHNESTSRQARQIQADIFVESLDYIQGKPTF